MIEWMTLELVIPATSGCGAFQATCEADARFDRQLAGLMTRVMLAVRIDDGWCRSFLVNERATIDANGILYVEWYQHDPATGIESSSSTSSDLTRKLYYCDDGIPLVGWDGLSPRQLPARHKASTKAMKYKETPPDT